MKKLTCLLFIALIVFKGNGQKSPCNQQGLPYAKVPGDTTITLPHGTQLTFNRCEYFDLRECLELEEAFDMESIRRQNLTTLDRNGNFLLTAGMFCMRLTGDCKSKPCFEVPVKARLPLPNLSSNNCGKCERGTFQLYNTTDGFWSDSTNNRFRIIDSAGRHWLEFTIYCANICYNGDCVIRSKGGKTKIKVKGLSILDKVEITNECPIGVLKYYPKTKKKKVIARLPCIESDSVKISATGTDKNGSPVTYSWKSIRELKHRWGKRNCEPGRLGRKTKTGSFYRKYILYP